MSAAVAVAGLTKRFGDVTAVDDLSLVVEGPGVFGFLGQNGAGKSTTIKMLTGLVRPTAGDIRLLGEPVRAGDGGVRRRLGYLPQDPGFYPWMTGVEYLLFTAALFGVTGADARRRAAACLDRCGLDEGARKRRVGGWSGGMKQRLGIAAALIHEPKLLLLDEPVSALDPVGRADVLALLEELGADATVLMSSHILADVERVCADVAILHEGRLLAHEPVATLKARARKSAFDVTLHATGTAAEAVAAALRAAAEVVSVTPLPRAPGASDDVTPLRVFVRDTKDGERALPRLLAAAQAPVVSLAVCAPSLEEVFISLVGHHEEVRT